MAERTLDLLSRVDIETTSVALQPADVLLTTCVVLTNATNVIGLKLPDLTMVKILKELQKISGNIDKILKAPLNEAIEYFQCVTE